ncbi:GNAT family N-acetyltransferase [Enterococcus sp. BWB1-3]|uniref:GNAT family N-acetyltransferase n=1 Tax=unclassified Enterococcus TaxID=2608891 RepID=UPI001922B17F|nr:MULTISPECIES: GNAT family N-acetyltransferase [unclassified Enterococcus]MBL1229868.1 GNAT family N-acetyltransferase [Enterococcus sp. BWB1-3]MCB5951384.1 GNAT family N-acetyltransferase [Enterococcus sp. BWT-B8]MCB5954942.1 GNAT family N-acetyltransferase [Enterococcus sp. CWB-B31]
MIEELVKPSKEELKELSAIWLSVNLEAHPFIPEAYWQSNLEMVKSQLEEAGIYVYRIQDQIVAFAGLQGDYIAGIFVCPDYRGQGIGKSLLEEIKREYQQLELAVYSKNTKAVAFYKRENFFVASEEVDKATGEWEYHMKWQK